YARPLRTHASFPTRRSSDIRQQRERELVAIAKRTMTLGGLWTDTGHVEAGLLNRHVQVTNAAGLTPAAGCEVRGIEVENQRPVTQQSAQRDVLATVVRQGEFRCSRAYFQHPR